MTPYQLGFLNQKAWQFLSVNIQRPKDQSTHVCKQKKWTGPAQAEILCIFLLLKPSIDWILFSHNIEDGSLVLPRLLIKTLTSSRNAYKDTQKCLTSYVGIL